MPPPASADVVATPTARILISDDDIASRSALITILERAGFSCRSAESAAETLALLAEGEFDLMITDINMPGNAGLEMVRTLSEREDVPPIILLTGQPSIETATQAVRLRVYDYLLKPFDADKLIALARAGIASHRMTQVIRTHRARLKSSLAEINRCEELSRNASPASANAALSTYLSLAVQQSLSTIAEIGDLAGAIVDQDGGGEIQRRLQAARPFVLLDAVRETIQVLETTRHSFKSRELGDLRKKLEFLVKSGRET